MVFLFWCRGFCGGGVFICFIKGRFLVYYCKAMERMLIILI